MLWRRRRWRYLLNLIDHLPRDSAYMEAIANDEQLAEQLVRNLPEQAPAGPRLSDWSPEVEALYALVDRVVELIHVTAAASGAKPGKVRMSPRPVTAIERARNRQRASKHKSLVARVMRDRPPPSTT